MIQMLWDRGEPNGYAWHMTERPAAEHAARTRCSRSSRSATTRWPTSPPRCEARTIGSHLRLPAVDPGRHTDRHALLRDPADPTASRTTGDASLVVWDIGPLRRRLRRAGRRVPRHATPPIGNTPPRIGVDPHDLVIESEARVRRQISEFLRIDGA